MSQRNEYAKDNNNNNTLVWNFVQFINGRKRGEAERRKNNLAQPIRTVSNFPLFRVASLTVTNFMNVPIGEKGESIAMPKRHLVAGDEEIEAPLIAAGIRRKDLKVCVVDVYVIGLYFSPLMCKRHESERDSLKAVANDSEIPKIARLVFLRDVSGNSVAKAIAKNIEKKLGNFQSKQDEEAAKKAKEALELFRKMFRGVKIEKGASLTFTTDSNGTLRTILRSKEIGPPIRDERLCAALFESWMCKEESVIPELTAVASSILTQALASTPPRIDDDHEDNRNSNK